MRIEKLPTPCYLIEEEKLIKNLEILKGVMDRTGCKILLAQKAFSMFSMYPLIGSYLSGATASGLYEARLAKEYMGKENHIFSPAYKEEEMDEIASLCGHVVFNSFSQLERFGNRVREKGASIGLRINPEHSTQEGHEIYDPCARGSRLGIPLSAFRPELLEGVEGLHFHTLCEQNADALLETLRAVEEKFGPWVKQMKWINFGGGHHITRSDYDISLLESCIRHIQETYQVQVYLEPGEAVALNAGHLITSVLEIMENEMQIAILDTSAACHMPDVLEMPYRPPLSNSGNPGEKPYTYRLAGPTCLAGDVIGDYSFQQPLQVGQRLFFEDMAIYSMVKNNTFNGMPLPTIAVRKADGSCEIVREFGYEDFKMRLS
ncbi:MAG: carboxynorspermidine decarboxylase [Lachnospiraceae bacterium]|nr:carboxynorspermidine decarboxylase [Lachnospiraceae bacterium]